MEDGMNANPKDNRPQPQDEQAQRIRENMADIDWETVSFDELDDLFEDRDPAEFL